MEILLGGKNPRGEIQCDVQSSVFAKGRGKSSCQKNNGKNEGL